MALDYFAPGVYVEEVDRGSRPMDGISMSVAGFVGFTEDVRGDAELFKPIMITNWKQYLECFGKPGSDGFTSFGAYLPFTVQGWFLNGGGRCWVVSIGTKLPGSQQLSPEEYSSKLLTSSGKPSLSANLKLPEATGAIPALPASGSRLAISILESGPKPLAEDAPEDAQPTLNTGEYFTLIVRDGDEILERYDHLSMNPQAQTEIADYVVEVLEASEYVTIADISQSGQPLSRRPSNGSYEVAPPPYIASAENAMRDLQGQRDERTGVQ